ncbi:MAG: hypothetical protein HZY73_14655 [Micropruina sp.]|nr:MAG: hypothetical protein HZY73_14655 [Micropruina sp.]
MSRSTATAIEPCVLLRFDFRVVEQLAQRHIEWAQLLITYFYAHVLHVQADAYLTRSHTAEQRYRLLLERHPAGSPASSSATWRPTSGSPRSG